VARLAIVELHKDDLHFSAGHFTIFSATERENLHGHNYNVNVCKNKLTALCQQLDRRFLLPRHSKYLRIEDTGDMIFAHFNKERIPFLKRDVTILPVCNVTIEELSNWFLQKLILDEIELKRHKIQGMIVRVFNSPGQSGATRWGKF